jgi:hypothetical protein
MPMFTVLCRVDAYVDYTARVEADDAEQAADLACDSPGDYIWEERGAVEFDACGYVALDAKDEEIEVTRRGYFG